MVDEQKIPFQRKDSVKRAQVEHIKERLIRRVNRSHSVPMIIAVFLGFASWKGMDIRTWQVWAPLCCLGSGLFLTMALSVCPRCAVGSSAAWVGSLALLTASIAANADSSCFDASVQ